MKTKNSFFIKYMAIISLLFFIPFGVLGFVMFQHFFSVFENRTIQNNSAQMEKVFQDLEQNLSNLNIATHQIYLDRTLSRYSLKEDPFQKITAVHALTKLNLMIPYIDTLYLIYKDDNFIYSTAVAYTRDAFKKHVLNNNSNSWARLNSILKNQTGKTVIFDSELHKLFLVHMIKAGSSNPYGAIIYEVSPSFIKDHLETNSFNDISDFYLLSDTSQIIMASNINNSDIVNRAISLRESNKNSRTPFITIDNIRYFYSYRESKSTGLQYVSLTKYSTVMKELISIRNTYFIIIVSLGILGLLLMGLTVFLNYLPIHRLRQKSATLIPEGFKNGSSPELEVIDSAINYLTVQNKALTEKYSSEKYNIARIYLRQLIKGEIQDFSKFMAKTSELNLNLNTQYHTVSAIYSKSFSALPDIEYLKLLESIKEIIGYNHNLLDYRLNNLIIVIFNLEEEELPMEILRIIQVNLNQKCKEVSIGCGNIYSDLSEVPRIYLESTMALESRYIYGNKNILTFQNPESKVINIDLSLSSNIQEFIQALLQCNPEKTESVLNSIRLIMADSKLAIQQCQLIGYDIYKVFQDTLQTLGSDRGLNINIDKLRDFNTNLSFIELEDRIIKTVTLLHKDLDNKKQSEKNSKVERIEEYIIKRYKDAQFSLHEVADEFGLSQSVLSSLYKEVKGNTTSCFLTKLRIKEAKKLLQDTDLTIDQIAIQSGYYNSSSFIRRFKQMTGTTPGMYRAHSSNR